MVNNKVKAILSKINFWLNRNPVVESCTDPRKFIPSKYQAVLTITADFELAWAWRYSKSTKDAYTLAIEKAEFERENIPKILELCESYNIPITWAAAGHLFLKDCNKLNGKAHPEIPAVKNYEGQFWDFQGNDWFEYDPCSNYKEAPEWYAPDLIEKIINSKVKHEIGCHTFSHIDCRDEVCPPELFEAEINECKKAAAKFGIELKSFVHPGHSIGNLNKLAESGFTSFQSDPGNILGYPVKHKNNLWELKRTYEFVYRKGWSDKYHIYRYITIIKRAIKNNVVCNFWFHPSLPTEFISNVLPSLFEFIDSKKDEISITTVGNYVDWLNGENR